MIKLFSPDQARSRTIHYDPLIIIGAARSGTNMLRDVLTKLPGFGTWPCDEINYIWRHGNRAFPTDEFTPEQATPYVQNYIHSEFNNLAGNANLSVVVEKTCANSLRLNFVDRIFPNAKFIIIVRDGRDTIASSMKRWVAPLDLPYVLRKARFVPITDIPYHGIKYLSNLLNRINSKERRLATWGPKFVGMTKMLHEKSLVEVCAEQWARSVERTLAALEQIEPSRIHLIQYEIFVQCAREEVIKLVQFLGLNIDAARVEDLTANISDANTGKWRRELTQDQLNKIYPRIEVLLQKFNYE